MSTQIEKKEEMVFRTLLNKKDEHNAKAENRLRFALTLYASSLAVTMGLIQLGERGSGRDDQGKDIPSAMASLTYRFLPFLLVSVGAIMVRFHVVSARTEELMKDVYERELERRLGQPIRFLSPELNSFVDERLEFYSQRDPYKRWSAVIVMLSYFAIILIWLYAGIRTGGDAISALQSPTTYTAVWGRQTGLPYQICIMAEGMWWLLYAGTGILLLLTYRKRRSHFRAARRALERLGHRPVVVAARLALESSGEEMVQEKAEP